MSTDLNLELLKHSAYLELDGQTSLTFYDLAKKVTDWENLIQTAELNALSNLLHRHLKTAGIVIPQQHTTTFKALTARHTRNNRERKIALYNIISKLSELDIDAILLKGMALIHTLYTEQAQRPMGDIDILVSAQQALNAQQALRDIGYKAADRKTDYLYDHHHLPMASLRQNGLMIQVEIHHNALSGDAMGSMAFEDVIDNCYQVDIQDSSAYVLGHTDTIKHLCHHTFEPCDKIKLGAVADIYGIATKYHDEIHWKAIKKSQPYIVNTLRCLHFLTPLPAKISQQLDSPSCPPPQGVGSGFPPLSNTMNMRGTRLDKLKRLLICPDWWKHIYYRVPPENTLLWVKIFRHPIKVTYWIARRLIAKLKSNLANRKAAQG